MIEGRKKPPIGGLLARARRIRGRWALGAAVAAVCAVAGVALVSAPAGAVKAHASWVPPLYPGGTYLALGDSVTFGYMESSVVPAPNYEDASSFVAYPEQLGAELGLNVVNAACPGETSASLVNSTVLNNGCTSSPGSPSAGYRTAFPLHVSYTGSQLDFAVHYLRSHHNVGLVSLMIGANDFFLCEETTTDGCASSSEQEAVAASVTKNVQTILSEIRYKAHYSGQLAIVNYYSLDYASPTDNAQAQNLNQVLDAAAQPFHVVIADGYGELQTASVHSGDDTCTAGLLTQLGVPGDCGVHPSYAGQALLAQALAKIIRFI